MSIILNFCLFPNHHIIFYCITLSLFSILCVQFFGISLLVEFDCGVEHCCNKNGSHKNLLNRTLFRFGLSSCFAVDVESEFRPRDTHCKSFIRYFDSAYRLLFLPQLHCRLVLLKLMTPVGVYLLIVVAFIWGSASVKSPLDKCQCYRQDSRSRTSDMCEASHL